MALSERQSVGTPLIELNACGLFGSTAKVSQTPSDVDILFEGFECGLHQNAYWNCRNAVDCKTNKSKKIRIAKTDKDYLRRYGIRIGLSSRVTAFRFLRGNKKMVRFHPFEVDGCIAYPRIMLYPRNDLKTQINKN